MINFNKKQWTIIIGIGAIVLIVIIYYIYTVMPKQNYEEFDVISQQDTNQEENIVEESTQIVVHIAGEVKIPGIIKIQEGARIADIIEKAGGLTDKANITNVNLAYIVEDGQKITIPLKTEDNLETEIISDQNGDSIIQNNDNKTSFDTVIININKADVNELQQLQGIGEATALKIIEYRKQNGDFKKIEDIKNVSGIGEAKFESIKENIKVK